MAGSTRNFISALLLTVSALNAFAQQPKRTAKAPSMPELKVIQDLLYQNEFEYFVKGTVYNPHDKAVKNVVIKYYVWKKLMSVEDSKLTQEDAEVTKAKVNNQIAAIREQIATIKASPSTNTAEEVEKNRQILALRRKVLEVMAASPRPDQTGGLVIARLKYIPPKQSVDFTATGCCADVLASDKPDPLSAEMTAEWDSERH